MSLRQASLASILLLPTLVLSTLAMSPALVAQVVSESAQPLDQSTPGVIGTAEDGDLFAFSLASGDFNGDGSTDLASGAPGETFEGIDRVGVVHILYGAPAIGLQASSPNDQLFSQATTGVPGDPEAGDGWGSVLASADFNRDGYDDLAIGTPFEAIGSQDNAGAVTVLFGGPAGLSTAGAQLFFQGYSGNPGPPVPSAAEASDHFGASFATADFDGDGFTDLVAGAPGEDGVGAAFLFLGTANGLVVPAIGTKQITGSYPNGNFGHALAAGDFNLDGRADLAVGAPLAKPTNASTGVLEIFNGSANTNLTQNHAQRFVGIGSLGWALAAGNLNRRPGVDLAAGAPTDGSGYVLLLYGAANGLRQALSDELGGVTAPDDQTFFGLRLHTEPLNSDDVDDLLVSGLLPGSSAGVINVYLGNEGVEGQLNAPQGPRTDLIQKLQAGKYGIPGASDSDNGFGLSLATGRFRGSSSDRQLVLGYPAGPAGSTEGGTSFVFELDDRRPGACVQGPQARCLLNGQFTVKLLWSTASDNGAANVVQQGTDDSALLWFFAEDNWEMLVKMLDACAINGHFWLYAAPTTDVGYTLIVTDAVNGGTKFYSNTLGQPAQAIADVTAFPCPSSGGLSGLPVSASGDVAMRYPMGLDATQLRALPQDPSFREGPESPSLPMPLEADLCVADHQTLCLQNGTIEVTLAFAAPGGPSTSAQVAGPATGDSGLFWFFAEDNWEMLVKVLNGCAINGNYWVFAGAATDVRYTLQVRNVITGETATFTNPQGNLARSITDTTALACPAI